MDKLKMQYSIASKKVVLYIPGGMTAYVLRKCKFGISVCIGL